MDEDNANYVRVDAHWNHVFINGKPVWLTISGQNRLFQQYLQKYGPPSDFEVSLPDKDILYKAS